MKDSISYGWFSAQEAGIIGCSTWETVYGTTVEVTLVVSDTIPESTYADLKFVGLVTKPVERKYKQNIAPIKASVSYVGVNSICGTTSNYDRIVIDGPAMYNYKLGIT